MVVAVLFRVYYLPLSLRPFREEDAERLDKMTKEPIEKGKEDWKKVSDFCDNNGNAFTGTQSFRRYEIL